MINYQVSKEKEKKERRFYPVRILAFGNAVFKIKHDFCKVNVWYRYFKTLYSLYNRLLRVIPLGLL